MTPLAAVAVPCCGSGAVRVNVSASLSGPLHQVVIGTWVARPARTSVGKPEFAMQLGLSLWVGASVNDCVEVVLSPPALVALYWKLSVVPEAGAVYVRNGLVESPDGLSVPLG